MPATNTLRYGLKPLLFTVCLLPFTHLLLGAFALANQSLGADPVARVLHTTGAWSLRLLIITLMVTPLRQLLKQPWLIAFRRMLGLFAFFYALLHFTTWLVLDRELDFSSVSHDLMKRPYITLGFTALLLLIPLACTSTHAMMRRLGKRWQKLHRLIYLIVILGVWHFYWQVKADIREPLIYASVVAVLFGWRFLRKR